MVRLTRIYTKTGDKGKTSLASGKRVSKDNIRIRAYGADLATPIISKPKFKPLRITVKQVLKLEKWIDGFNKKLEPLNSFILPGGSLSASYLHNARTVARRAETNMVSLALKEKVNSEALTYINRLSDLLFVLSRVENGNGRKDILWKPGINT